MAGRCAWRGADDRGAHRCTHTEVDGLDQHPDRLRDLAPRFGEGTGREHQPGVALFHAVDQRGLPRRVPLCTAAAARRLSAVVGGEARDTDVANVDDGVVLGARHRAEVVQHSVGDLYHLALVDAGQHAGAQ